MRRSTIAATTALSATIALGVLASAQAPVADSVGVTEADPTSYTYEYAPLPPGSYRFEVHDMTVDLELEAGYWVVVENGEGRTTLSDAGPAGPIGRDVMFISASRLAGGAADIATWIDEHPTVVDGHPIEVSVGGHAATRFDVDPSARGGYDFLESLDGQMVRLETERDYRVWWIDGDHDPFAIIVTSDRNDHPLLFQAEAMLDTLHLGPRRSIDA